MEVGSLIQGFRSVLWQADRRTKGARRFHKTNASRLANVDVLEIRLLLTADFGDAPDTTAATGVNNYQTLAANGGPSHVIDTTQTTLYLGGGVDGEAGTQQSLAANLDNLFTTGGRNDEDGVMSSLDLTATVGASPKITLSATNTTGTAATLYGWIDYNHNGVFENATERAQIAVPTGTTAGRFTLQFPKIIGDVAGGTYARFRLSSSSAAAANPTGVAIGGEVEDYQFQIMNRVNLQGDAPSTLRISSGVNGGPAIPATEGYAYAVNIPIGDLDGNGVVDLASGSIENDNLGLNNGAVYILFRDTDGTVSRYVRIASGINGGPQLSTGERFGTSIVNLGDIDGDGVTDLAVGSMNNSDVGAFYILRLNPNGTAKESTKLASGQKGVPVGIPGSSFRQIARLGDVNGDGTTDIAIVDIDARGEGMSTRGALYILRLNTDGTVKDSSILENSSTWNPAIAGNTIFNTDAFGLITSAIGDLDGDGVVDLAVTSKTWGTITTDAVTFINLLKLNADGTLKDVSSLATGPGGTPGLDNMQAIYSITSIGDIDGNGVPDLAVSGSGTIGWSYEQSVLTVLKMNSNGTVRNFVSLPILNASGDGSYYGGSTSLTSIANIDGSHTIGIGMPTNSSQMGLSTSSLTMLTFASATPATTSPAASVVSKVTTATTDSRPKFSWNGSADATEYEIWLKNMSTGQVLLKSVFVNGTTYTPSDALGIGKYSIAVRAVNEVGPSTWSRSLNFTINSSVFNPYPSGGIDRRPQLSWSPLAGASQYDIWVSEIQTPAVAAFRKRTNTNVETYKLDKDLPDGVYQFQIRGIASDGTLGTWSKAVVFTIHPSTAIKQVTQEFTLRPRIEWNPVVNAITYDVYIRSTKSGSAPIQTQVSGLTNSAFIPTSDLAAGDYRIWVRGLGTDGNRGPWSAPFDFSAGTALQVQSSTSEATPQDFAQITIPSMVGAKYIDVWIDDPAPGMSPVSTGLKRLNYSSNYVPQLTSQGKYRIWVRIVAEDGTMTPWSAPVNLTVRGKPSSIIVVKNIETQQQIVYWTLVEGAVDYEIQLRNIDSNVIRTMHPNAWSDWFNLDSMKLLGRYEISIRAISADGTLGQWAKREQLYVNTPRPNLAINSGTVDTAAYFEWDALGDTVGYDVIIRNESTNKIEVTTRGVTSTNYTAPKLGVGNYEVWVIANGAKAVRSEWASAPFRIVAPEKPSVWIPGPPDRGYGTTGIVLNWNFEATADHFDVWVSDSHGVLVVRDTNATGNAKTLTTILPRDTYRVWVRAVFADGSNSPWSFPTSFSIY